MEKVVLGLSGGVDSAVSAALLKEQGFEVLGVFLDIGIAGAADAKSVADMLGIGFEVLPIAAELEEKVCLPFSRSYLAGRTPNPCIMCNPKVKFPALIAYADEAGAKYIATGHYARTETDSATGRTLLLKNRSPNDQSYMLCMLPQHILQRTIFPLGGMDKGMVRERAAGLGIPVAKKPDSMEICFIPDNDYAAYIEKRFGAPPEGNFVDPEGRVLGRHKGIHRYTVGQRRGLGVSCGQRMFVSGINPGKNEVVLTPEGEGVSEIRVKDINWIDIRPEKAFRASVKVRHSKAEYDAEVEPVSGEARVFFRKPVRRPAPGQSAVFYRGDAVIGGGEIQ